MKLGQVYVAQNDMLPIVVGAFRMRLSGALSVRQGHRCAVLVSLVLAACPYAMFFSFFLSFPTQATARALPQLEEDDRLLPMLNTLRYRLPHLSFAPPYSSSPTSHRLPSFAVFFFSCIEPTASSTLARRTARRATRAKSPPTPFLRSVPDHVHAVSKHGPAPAL